MPKVSFLLNTTWLVSKNFTCPSSSPTINTLLACGP